MDRFEIKNDDIDFARYMLPPDEHSRIVTPSSVQRAMVELSVGARAFAGLTLPWPKTRNWVRFPGGQVTVWSGKTFSGKTQLLKQIILHGAALQGEFACIASMEERPEETLLDMCTMVTHTERPDADSIDVFCNWLDGKVWCYNQQNLVHPERILGVMGYAAKELNCKQFVIDSWMCMDIKGDDLDYQDRFMNLLLMYAELHQLHVHVVVHQVKRGGKDKDGPGDVDDTRGSGNVINRAPRIVAMWRNPTPRIDRSGGVGGGEPDGMLVVYKQRGRPNWVGKIALWYDDASRQFKVEQFARPLEYLPGLAVPPQPHHTQEMRL